MAEIPLPSWWETVKLVMSGLPGNDVPVPVWLAIQHAENASGDASEHHKFNGADIVGLFQIEIQGGQGAGYTVEQLQNPQFNASVAKKAILFAYNQRVGHQGWMNDDDMGRIAIDSGHAYLKNDLSDAGIQNIMRIWRAIAAVKSQGDAAMYTAASAATGGGGVSNTLPGNTPGAGNAPTGGGSGAASGGGPSLDPTAGFTSWASSIAPHVALGIVAILLIIVGAVALALQEVRE